MPYRDRKGQPIESVHVWADLFKDPNYHFLARTTLPNGRHVVTVWEGLDLRPLFSTGVFSHTPDANAAEEPALLEERSYETEEAAMTGHAALVRKWIAKE